MAEENLDPFEALEKLSGSENAEGINIQVLTLRCLKEVNNSLKSLNSTVSSLQTSIENTNETVTNIQAKCANLETTTKSQSQEIEQLKLQNYKLSTKLDQLTEKTMYMDSQTRRSNLIFYGLTESTPDDCENKVKHFIKVQLGLKELFEPDNLEQDSAASATAGLQLERCYRIGQKRKDDPQPRPIIVKFSRFQDRQTVWQKRKVLREKGPQMRISEDFPEEILERRRLLKPILSKAIGLKYEAFLKVDRLSINSRLYSVDELHKLPEELNPVSLSTRTVSPAMVAFYGANSPLSNFHSAKFIESGQQFDHVEQYFHYHRALAGNDEVVAGKILSSSSPIQCKRLGKSVKLNLDAWKQQEIPIMLRGCTLKFQQNPKLAKFLLDTGDKQLVEANGYDKFWGAGMALDNVELPNGKWDGKNQLGLVLQQVRQSLKP